MTQTCLTTHARHFAYDTGERLTGGVAALVPVGEADELRLVLFARDASGARPDVQVFARGVEASELLSETLGDYAALGDGGQQLKAVGSLPLDGAWTRLDSGWIARDSTLDAFAERVVRLVIEASAAGIIELGNVQVWTR